MSLQGCCRQDGAGGAKSDERPQTATPTAGTAGVTVREYYRNEIVKDFGAVRQTIINASENVALGLATDDVMLAFQAMNIAESLVAKAIG